MMHAVLKLLHGGLADRLGAKDTIVHGFACLARLRSYSLALFEGIQSLDDSIRIYPEVASRS